MDDNDFDRALIAAAFTQIGESGWRRLDLAAAARAAGLDVARTRARFPGRCALLARFGRIADQAALAGVPAEGAARDHLFDMLMRRIDVLQAHRGGVLALLRALPTDPPAAALLSATTLRSMAWMLRGAGARVTPPLGLLRAKGLMAVWLWTVRAWRRDTSDDLAMTMAALDGALSRAGQVQSFFCRRRHGAEADAEAMPLDPIAEPISEAPVPGGAAPPPPAPSPQADPGPPG